MPEQQHECDWCLDELPCAAVGPLWICGDCEADVFMFPAAMGGDPSPKSPSAPVHREEEKR